MSVVDDIQAVLAREDLTRREKLVEVARLKREAWIAAAQGQTLDFERGIFTIVVSNVRQVGEFISCDVVVKRTSTGNEVWKDTIRFHNPPLYVPDPLGELDRGEQGRFRLAPLAAFRQTLVRVLRSVTG